MTPTAVEPVTVADAPAPPREPGRWAAIAFGAGAALGFVFLGLHFAWIGYRLLPLGVFWYLLWLPLLVTSLTAALRRKLRPAEPRPTLRDLRPSTRTLMVVVAYLALLLGLGVTGGRLGLRAGEFHFRHLGARHQATVFRTLADRARQEARTRLESARTVREGRVHPALLSEQQTFLRSLDRGADPDYRRERYELIADYEEQRGRLAGSNVPVYDALATHHEGLAAKYARAEDAPWLDVPPDPPLPTTGTNTPPPPPEARTP